jgi:hypothetical protein
MRFFQASRFTSEISMETTTAPFSTLMSMEVTLENCVSLLDARRLLICEEIQSRSHANAACDVDFNTLLAERNALTQALTNLTPLARHEARIAHPRE